VGKENNMKKAKAIKQRKPLTYGDYGRVRLLQVVATDRGGLALIATRTKANGHFETSNQQFWVRAGDVGAILYAPK
jgi:hypothetical protein